ncbi:MAG: hypothetical protein JW820_13730 [Spirochaetales bacterium]|nr:hypothetical protein [Spirochaetales bacterium]
MEKISPEAKKRYAEKIKEHKQRVDTIQEAGRKSEALIQGKLRQSGLSGGRYRVDTPEEYASLKEINRERRELAESYLNLVSDFNLMNDLSLSLLGIRNEGYLNDARKCCYRCIILMEEIVSPYVDAPFSEYEQGVDSIEEIGDRERYGFVRKLGFAIDSVIEGFGSNSKWRWSFVELAGRYAVITKNLINLKTFLARLDPRVEGYSERLAHMQLALRLLQQAADRYREKYELSKMRLDDIKQAIGFLAALKRLHALMGEVEEAEIVKKKMEVWKTKMEADQKKREQDQRIAKLRGGQDG